MYPMMGTQPHDQQFLSMVIKEHALVIRLIADQWLLKDLPAFLREASMNTGMNRESREYLVGPSHLIQSIRDILTRPIRLRAMRRDYGSRLFDLIDPPVDGGLLRESRLRFERITESLTPGRAILSSEGFYLPEGREITLPGIILQ